MTGQPSETGQAEFSVAKGNPTDEELGALMAVLQASTAGHAQTPADDRPVAGGWKSHYRRLRRPLLAGREGWRGAFRP